MSTPALARLREACPASQIALLSSANLAELWHGHPAIDRILTFESSEGILSVAGRLRRERFEAAILFPNSPRSAFEVWLAGIPIRIGYAAQGRGWLLTNRVARPAGYLPMRKRSRHEVKALATANARSGTAGWREGPVGTAHHTWHYLRLTEALGAELSPVAPRIYLGAEEAARVRQRFELNPALSWLGVNAGAAYGPAKQWPLDRFARVVREFATRPGWGIVVVGGPGDCRLVTQLLHTAGDLDHFPNPVVNAAGRTSLRELCAVLAACRVVVTNDSGPMHLAAAVNTHVVGLFGSTDPRLTAPGLPGNPRTTILFAPTPCSPCFRKSCPIDFRCMRDLDVDQVLQAIHRASLTCAA